MKKHIKIFDTTLRDGEQTPRVNLNAQEKLRIAKQLESLGVDVIEAGFAVASPGDFEAVKMIAENVEKSTVTSLSRAVKKDIEVAAEAVKNAKKPRIHTFIATSPIHREYKLKMTKEQILDRVKEMVSYAKSFIDDIEFSSEDATRTEKEVWAASVRRTSNGGTVLDFNVIRGVLTLVFLIFFLGVIVYAWSKKNKARFDEAAMLPLNEPNERKNG